MGYLKAVILIKAESELLRSLLDIFTLPKQHLQKWRYNRLIPDCGTTFQILIRNFMLCICTFFSSNLAKLDSKIKVPVHFMYMQEGGFARLDEEDQRVRCV